MKATLGEGTKIEARFYVRSDEGSLFFGVDKDTVIRFFTPAYNVVLDEPHALHFAMRRRFTFNGYALVASNTWVIGTKQTGGMLSSTEAKTRERCIEKFNTLLSTRPEVIPAETLIESIMHFAGATPYTGPIPIP